MGDGGRVAGGISGGDVRQRGKCRAGEVGKASRTAELVAHGPDLCRAAVLCGV
jgi:hypothetical protein